MITKKHFKELAAIVRCARGRFRPDHSATDVIEYFQVELADLCSRENPRFNRATFGVACQLPQEDKQ
jgi:hypothetical protein